MMHAWVQTIGMSNWLENLERLVGMISLTLILQSIFFLLLLFTFLFLLSFPFLVDNEPDLFALPVHFPFAVCFSCSLSFLLCLIPLPAFFVRRPQPIGRLVHVHGVQLGGPVSPSIGASFSRHVERRVPLKRHADG